MAERAWAEGTEVWDELDDASGRGLESAITPRVLVDNFPNGALLVFDRDLRYVLAGGAWLTLAGYTPGDLEGRTVHEALPPDAVETIEPAYRAAIDQGDETTTQMSLGGRTFSVRVTPLRDVTGTVVGGMVASQDVTRAQEQHAQLRLAEERFRATFDHAPIGMALLDLDGSFTQVNAAATEILGYDEAALVGLTFQEITHPDDLSADLAHLERLLNGEIRSYRMEKRYFNVKGHVVWAQLSMALVYGSRNEPLHLVAQIEDISDRKRNEEMLTRLAQRDSLTGLMNRAVLERDLAIYERAAERYGDRCVVMMIDLDGFKLVNDAGGHEAGDEVLRQVARTIRGRLRLTDHAYRLGGDEFAVLVPHATEESARTLAEAIEASIAALRVRINDVSFEVRASVGLAAVMGGPARGRTLARADAAMYEAKRSGSAVMSTTDITGPIPR